MTLNDCGFTKLGKESIYNVIIIHMKGVPIKSGGGAVNPPPIFCKNVIVELVS